MNLDPGVVAAFVAGIASIAGVVVAGHFAARSARVAQQAAREELAQKVDAQAFQRARENYDAALAEQEARIGRLHREIDENRREYLAQMAECQQMIGKLQHDLRALREWALPLLSAARAAGIQYSDPPVWTRDDSDDTGGVL